MLANEDADFRVKFSKQFFDTVFCLFIIATGVGGSFWMLSDVTGEYTANDPHIGVVRMSVIRRATNVKSELSFGRGAILAASIPSASPGDKFSWKYVVPEEWVSKGQPYREVYFYGTIKDGIATGIIKDGIGVYPVKLTRNTFASLYRQVQSHLPFMG